MAITARVNQERGQCAVRFLLGGDSCQFDDGVGLIDDLLEHRRRVIRSWCEAVEQLFGGHHDLVRCLAATTAATHPVGHDTQQTARDTLVCKKIDLILLVVTVALVNTCGGRYSITFGHCVISRVVSLVMVPQSTYYQMKQPAEIKKLWN